MSFLNMKGASKGYGRRSTRVEVLRDINLEIQEGESVAIVGYSGSGKSTLIQLLSDRRFPTRGALALDGKRIEARTGSRSGVPELQPASLADGSWQRGARGGSGVPQVHSSTAARTRDAVHFDGQLGARLRSQARGALGGNATAGVGGASPGHATADPALG
ncbi:MAG: ATP-binding cassette domain-containing protein [Fibrobacteres bacterium]|nr:ATP-binding cassette domain-containing protein [Fibrobacterota bacterium]